MKNTITKEEFLKAIESLRQQNAVDDNFQTHMEAAFPGSYAPIYENHLWTLSVHLLELLMEDPYKYIDWWVWETHFGKEHPNVTWTSPDGETEKTWTLDTPEALYDFLVENAKHNEANEPIALDSNKRIITTEEFMQIAEKQILGNK